MMMIEVSVVPNARLISQCTRSRKGLRNLPKNVMEAEFEESEWCAVQTGFKLQFLQLKGELPCEPLAKVTGISSLKAVWIQTQLRGSI